MKSKIISITEIMADWQKGITIEPISENYYNTEIWFNQKKEFCDVIINSLLKLIVENMIVDIDLIVIGKEIVYYVYRNILF